METLKLVFYILGSSAFLGLIIFFIALIFNKDDGIDLEQGRINYLSREVDRLEKKISNAPIPDNQHGKETEGKRYPDDFEDIAKKMSFKLSDLKPTEKDVALAFQKQFFDSHKYELNGIINALKEKNKIQSDKFEAKEKMYVEKIRQLEKILTDEEIKISAYGNVSNLKADSLKNIINDTEKKRTEAYELIHNVYMFKDTVLLDYGRYIAEEIDLSEFEKELEITFKNYCRQEKIIKEKTK